MSFWNRTVFINTILKKITRPMSSPQNLLKGNCNYDNRVSCTPSIPSTTKILQILDMSCCICTFDATKPARNFR